jgi:hypothetical protein
MSSGECGTGQEATVFEKMNIFKVRSYDSQIRWLISVEENHGYG